MGAGKTLKAVEVARQLGAKTILLIAPLNTRLGWQVTFERQGAELPFKWIRSTKEGLANLSDWEWQQPGIYFVGVEYFVRLGWNGKDRTKTWSHAADLVLFDEVHRSQNRKSKNASHAEAGARWIQVGDVWYADWQQLFRGVGCN